ncbi:unnamed protein product [Lampetra fluviatilis]
MPCRLPASCRGLELASPVGPGAVTPPAPGTRHCYATVCGPAARRCKILRAQSHDASFKPSIAARDGRPTFRTRGSARGAGRGGARRGALLVRHPITAAPTWRTAGPPPPPSAPSIFDCVGGTTPLAPGTRGGGGGDKWKVLGAWNGSCYAGRSQLPGYSLWWYLSSNSKSDSRVMLPRMDEDAASRSALLV